MHIQVNIDFRALTHIHAQMIHFGLVWCFWVSHVSYSPPSLIA